MMCHGWLNGDGKLIIYAYEHLLPDDLLYLSCKVSIVMSI